MSSQTSRNHHVRSKIHDTEGLKKGLKKGDRLRSVATLAMRWILCEMQTAFLRQLALFSETQRPSSIRFSHTLVRVEGGGCPGLPRLGVSKLARQEPESRHVRVVNGVARNQRHFVWKSGRGNPRVGNFNAPAGGLCNYHIDAGVSTPLTRSRHLWRCGCGRSGFCGMRRELCSSCRRLLSSERPCAADQRKAYW